MKKSILIILVALAGISASAQTNNTTVVTNLTTERFKAIIANAPEGTIIDLRTPGEIEKGYIKGATFIDYLAKGSEAQIDKLDKNKTYYIYCASGGRSGDCAEYMEKHGFKKVYNLEKGFSDWVTKGMPVEKK